MRNLAVILIGISNAACWGAPFQAASVDGVDGGNPNVLALAAPGAVTPPTSSALAASASTVDVDAGIDAIDSAPTVDVDAGIDAIDSAPTVDAGTRIDAIELDTQAIDAGNSWPSDDCEFMAVQCDGGHQYTCATDAGTIYACVLAYTCVRFDRYDAQCNKLGIGSGSAWACPIDISATGSGMLNVCDIAIQGDGTRATPSTISCCYSR